MPHGIFPPELALFCQERPGEQYTPSNGTEGEMFIDSWCRHCARDKSMRDGEPVEECDDEELCQILGASFRGEAKEWQYDKHGQPCCTAFVPVGQQVPAQRCEHTTDLFGGAQDEPAQ